MTSIISRDDADGDARITSGDIVSLEKATAIWEAEPAAESPARLFVGQRGPRARAMPAARLETIAEPWP